MTDPANAATAESTSAGSRKSGDDFDRTAPSRMTEVGIRSAIASLQALLPERSSTVRDLWDRYILTLPQDQRWVRCVRSMMVRVLDEIGDVQAIHLNPAHWTSYRIGKGTTVAASTRNLQLTRTKALLFWAVDEGHLVSNPLDRVKCEKTKKKRQTEISEVDEERVMAAAPLALNVLFTVAMGSAMRHDEIRLLRWDQIDFDARTISIAWDDPENKSRTNGTINLTEKSAGALRLMPRIPGSRHVFANPHTREPYTYSHLWKLFRDTADGLGIKAAPGDRRVTFHDTRRSVARRLDRAGARLTSIQGILRHANLATTAIYLETRPKEIAEDHALLEQPRKGPHRATPGTQRRDTVGRDRRKATA